MFSLYFLPWPIIATVLMVGMGLVINKKIPIYRSIFVFVLAYFVTWLTLPPLALDMSMTWVTAILWSCVAAGLAMVGQERFEKNPIGFVLPAVLFVGLIGVAFFTSGLFNASRMASVIEVTNNGQRETTAELVSQEQARRVTPSLALKRAAELIGSAEQPGLASVAEFGKMYGNVTPAGKAVWMAPLEPTGFFRWLGSPTTPGYFIASHVNVNDSRLVEDRPISYGDGFYISNDLSRHLYMNGYVNYRYGDAFFQIDSEGDPYYVVPMMRPQVGIHSYYPEKWAVVDAESGEIREYTAATDLPTWVDRAYPADVMEARLDDWGCYSSGPWACWFTGVEVIEPTPGMVITMDVENTMIYYTGTQFRNNKVEGATSGVSIINARTGTAEYYRRSGITEEAAVAILNGAVANYAEWSATDPVLIQVNGMETYFSVITDGSGAFKRYGMVWQRNRDVYGVGESVPTTLQEYQRLLRANRDSTALEGNMEIESITFEGDIVSLQAVVSGGETSFYLRLDSVDDKVFMVNSSDPAEVATSNVGERVRLVTSNAEPGVISVETFDNLMLELAESANQVALDEQTEAINTRNDDQRDRNDLEAQLRDMDPEEVRDALETIRE